MKNIPKKIDFRTSAKRNTLENTARGSELWGKALALWEWWWYVKELGEAHVTFIIKDFVLNTNSQNLAVHTCVRLNVTLNINYSPSPILDSVYLSQIVQTLYDPVTKYTKFKTSLSHKTSDTTKNESEVTQRRYLYRCK